MASSKSKERRIRAEMALRGVTASGIARRMSPPVSHQMVNAVIKGKAVSARVVRALVDAGIPEHLLKAKAD